MKKLLLHFLGFLPFPGWSQMISLGEIKKIDTLITTKVDDNYGCFVLIAQGDNILLQKGYGYLDSAKKRKTEITSLFHIASITKSITAVAILQLAAKNRLRLTDSLIHFYNNAPADKAPITIHQLLTHTSGFGQHYVNSGIQNKEDALNALLKDTLVSFRGTSANYSNENYEMLATIIEKISASSYEDYVQNNILKPAGMSNTYSWTAIQKVDPQRVADKLWKLPPNITATNWDYIGSAGYYSTSGDLFLFLEALKKNKILDSSNAKLLFKPQLTLQNGLSFSYGWFVLPSRDDGKEIFSRGNEDWGHNAVLRWFPGQDIAIIVLTNSGEDSKTKETANRTISNLIVNQLIK